MKKTFAFIGTGNMAFAIIGGLTNKDSALAVPPEDVILFDANKAQYDKFADGFTVAENIKEAVEKNKDVTVAFDKTLQVSFEGNAKEYRKARRAYYKAAYNTLIAEYNDGVAEILKKMNALLSPEQRNMNKEIANA